MTNICDSDSDDVSDSGDITVQNLKPLDTQQSEMIASVIQAMQETFQVSLDKVVDNMTKSFENQFSLFKNDLMDTLAKNNQVLVEQREKFIEDLDDMKQQLQEKDGAIQELWKSLEVMNARQNICDGRLTRSEKDIMDVKEDLLQQQARSMKDNLVFYNIKEKKDTDENTKKVLTNFLKEELKVSEENIEKLMFDRCHRIGKKGNQNRPIVAKCNQWGKTLIFQHLKNLDKTKKFGINEQLPRELNDRKQQLLPMFRDARDKKQPVKWIDEKLIVNEKMFEVKKDGISDKYMNTDVVSRSVNMTHAPPKVYGKSSFQGHVTPATSQDYILPSIHALYADNRVARATHNVYAYRISTENGIVEHYEDDKEHGAGRVLLNLMREEEVTNKLVVVSRWYGGEHLGPDRFNYIREAGKLALEMEMMEYRHR